MTDSVKPARAETGPMIVFEPVTVRSGPFWRAAAIARTALLIWGGVSLAASSGLALAYAGGAFAPDPKPAAERAVTEAVPAQAPRPEPAPTPRAEAAPAATDPVQTGSISPAPAPEPTGLARLRPADPAPGEFRVWPPTPASEAQYLKGEETAVARLPQPRPEQPTIVRGGARSRVADRPEPRFRRLSELRLPFEADRRLRVYRRDRTWPRPLNPDTYDW